MGAVLSGRSGDRPGYLLEELTWAEAEGLLAEDLVVLVPIGAATKEHGRHLPLGTDFYVADALRRAAVDRIRVVALPVVSYGYYPAFAAWPGSVSVGPVTFAATVSDIVRSLVRQGWRRFCLLNTGVSTTGPLDAACRELVAALPGIRLAMTRGLGEAAWASLREERAGTHAGEHETALMLAVRPDLVNMSEAEPEVIAKPTAFLTGAGGPPLANLYGEMTRDPDGPPEFFTASGVHGDPTLATADKGQAAWAAMVDDLVTVLEELGRLGLVAPGRPPEAGP